MFNKKQNKINYLESQINDLKTDINKLEDSKKNLEIKVGNLKNDKMELLGDFILILSKIQEEINSKSQWKHQKTTIDNQCGLAIERLEKIKTELENDIDSAIV